MKLKEIYKPNKEFNKWVKDMRKRIEDMPKSSDSIWLSPKLYKKFKKNYETKKTMGNAP